MAIAGNGVRKGVWGSNPYIKKDRYARALIRDSCVMADALSPVKNLLIRDIIDGGLPEQILLDDTESIARLLTDCSIDNVMSIAEHDLGMKPKRIYWANCFMATIQPHEINCICHSCIHEHKCLY